MTGLFDRLDRRLTGTSPMAQVIPPGGGSALAVIFVTAVLTFLLALALMTSALTTRAAKGWTDALGQSATVRITAPLAQREAQVAAALAVLRSTPGIESAQQMAPDAQLELLTPWMGEDLSLDLFELPTLLEITETDGGPDIEGLRLRLSGEAPGAVYDQHDAWRGPVITFAARVRFLGRATGFLLFGALVALVAVTVRASLMSHGREISALLLVGATDQFITRLFVRAAVLRALLGATLGLLGAALVLILLPSAQTGALSTGLRPSFADWIMFLVVPFVVAAITYGAARITAGRVLRSLI